MIAPRQQQGHGPNANVRRAIQASLDRMDAERRVTEAGDELTARTQLELLARAALRGIEIYEYETGLSVAVNDRQEAAL
jgi:hypothetical protein